jgi:hypothetical protein
VWQAFEQRDLQGTVKADENRLRCIMLETALWSRSTAPFDHTTCHSIRFALGDLSRPLLSGEHEPSAPLVRLQLVVADSPVTGLFLPDYCEVTPAFQPYPCKRWAFRHDADDSATQLAVGGEMLGSIALEPPVGPVDRKSGAEPQVDCKQMSLLGRRWRWRWSFRGCSGLLGHDVMLTRCVQWAVRCVHRGGRFR